MSDKVFALSYYRGAELYNWDFLVAGDKTNFYYFIHVLFNMPNGSVRQYRVRANTTEDITLLSEDVYIAICETLTNALMASFRQPVSVIGFTKI